MSAETKTTAAENEIRYVIRPTHYFDYDLDEETWKFEIHLPGIDKSKIKLKLLGDLVNLEAKRDQALYTLTEYFPFEIDVNSVKGEYDNGLLVLKGKIRDPLADAKTIELK